MTTTDPREIGQRNRERVRAYFRDHLCATNRDCAQALGLSEYAVGRHAREIRRESLSFSAPQLASGCDVPCQDTASGGPSGKSLCPTDGKPLLGADSKPARLAPHDLEKCGPKNEPASAGEAAHDLGKCAPNKDEAPHALAQCGPGKVGFHTTLGSVEQEKT